MRAGGYDLAIGTRVPDEQIASGLSPARQKLSDLGAWFFRLVAGAKVSDPMSGFFMTRREIVNEYASKLSPEGFKILVDLILSAGGALKIVEIPFVFRRREAGELKLSPIVGLDFLGLVAHHAERRLAADPLRTVRADRRQRRRRASRGALFARHLAGGRQFALSQSLATLTAMASNFVLNNEITYRAYRYRGFGMIGGFLLFALLCSVGAVANVNIASWVFRWQNVWWAAGLAGAPSASSGITRRARRSSGAGARGGSARRPVRNP